jgi:hypothetical protein
MAAIKLFNCEMIDMTANLGFGGQESSITLKLVECGGASYNGSLGCVYTINIGGFDFTGVIADHVYEKSSSGLTWTVRLTDGRAALSNVSVIMNDYYCEIDTPNLINVLSILESSVCSFSCADFMNSGKDSDGILMLFVLQAINGQSCLLPVCGETLSIDLSQIIAICPAYLQINDTSSDVLQIIDQACSEAGHDFFIEIQGSSFVAIPISKKVAPPPGALSGLLDTISAATCNGGATVDYRIGEEASYEPSKKFVLGENIHYMMVVSKDGDCTNKPGGGGIGGVVVIDNNPVIGNKPSDPSYDGSPGES